MINVFISHNPFTVETVFKINNEPMKNSFAEINKTRRLQRWIEQLFSELYNLTGGSSHFYLTFQGVEADWLDVQSAIEQAKCEMKMVIESEWIKSREAADRINDVQKLMIEAKEHPLFGQNITESPVIHKMFDEAMNKDFDVYVAATMSAGKSTLINAMLGADILPAANEATTATIAQITDNDKSPVGHFVGSRINKHDVEVDSNYTVSLDLLTEWNKKDDTKLIKLTGNIIGIKERENVRLVITDTPGPNNSQDPSHARATMQHIQDSVRNPLILYILNATQLGTNDDKSVLSEIAKIMQQGGKQSKDRFIFVVNKMDAFDPEAGENIQMALNRVKKYLTDNGIENPFIYPISANLTRLLRKDKETLTRKECGALAELKDFFVEIPEMDLVQYMPLTSSARRILKEKNLPKALERSGLPAIESMIDEYIDKYNLPERVKRAYDTINKAIEISSDKSKLDLQLEENVTKLEQIEEKLSLLVSNKDRLAKGQAKIDAMIQDKKSLYPDEIIRHIDDEEMKIRQKMNQFQEGFSSGVELSESQAINKINQLTQTINQESIHLINSLEKVILASQTITQEKLGKIFADYVQDLFEDLDEIPTPILDGLRKQVENIASFTGLGLQKKEKLKKKVVVGTEVVDDYEWYQFWRWGKKKKINVYENVEYVDAGKIWEDRESDIQHYFNELTKSARNKVDKDIETYATNFKSFMEQEFTVKFDEIIIDLQEKTKDREKVEALAIEAKAKLAHIDEFKAKLDRLLAL